jgi:hypothetical protein
MLHVDRHVVNLARKYPVDPVQRVLVLERERERERERGREMYATYILHGGPVAVAHVGVAESLSQENHWSSAS